MGPDNVSAPAFSIFGGLWSTPVAFFGTERVYDFQTLRSTDRFKIKIVITLFEADLRLCFRICKKTVFSRRGSFLAALA